MDQLTVVLAAMQIPSPYCPRTSGIECVENFDKLWTGVLTPPPPFLRGLSMPPHARACVCTRSCVCFTVSHAMGFPPLH